MTNRTQRLFPLSVLACCAFLHGAQGHEATDDRLAARKKIIADDFRPAVEGAKIAVAEYYAHRGTWPPKNEDAGVAAPAVFHTEFMRSLEIKGRTITITFDAVSGVDAGKVILVGDVDAGNPKNLKWTCVSPNIPDIVAILPYCAYVKTPAMRTSTRP